MGLKNKKFIIGILSTMLISTNIAPMVANGDSKESVNGNVIETEQGIIMEYEENENGEQMYVYEEIKDDGVYTKKFIKNSNILAEELYTTFHYKENEDGTINVTAEIHDLMTNEISTVVVVNETIDDKNIRANLPFPGDTSYRFVYSITGHVGFDRLTHAAVVGALTTTISGGRILAGSINGIATLVLNGGYSNLYYKKDVYHPTNTVSGRPIWKQRIQYYYDSSRKNPCGGSVFTESTVLTK